MTVYYITQYDIIDSKSYQEYITKVIPLLMKHGGELLVADLDTQVIEGEPKNFTAIIKFNTEEDAMNWYNDIEYIQAKNIRLKATRGNTAVLAKHFVPTEV